MQEKIDPTLLTRIGSHSVRPIDIRGIRWNFQSAASDPGCLDTSCSAVGGSFQITYSAPNYAQYVETLKFVSDSINWIPKSEWVGSASNHDDLYFPKLRWEGQPVNHDGDFCLPEFPITESSE